MGKGQSFHKWGKNDRTPCDNKQINLKPHPTSQALGGRLQWVCCWLCQLPLNDVKSCKSCLFVTDYFSIKKCAQYRILHLTIFICKKINVGAQNIYLAKISLIFYLIKEDTRMSKKHMKLCSASLVIRKIQINHRTSLHTPGMGKIKKNGNTDCW